MKKKTIQVSLPPGKPGSGFRYHDLVPHECEANIREDGTTQVSLSPGRPGSGFHIIDSDPHECVGIFVKKEPHRFLCHDRNGTRRLPYY